MFTNVPNVQYLVVANKRQAYVMPTLNTEVEKWKLHSRYSRYYPLRNKLHYRTEGKIYKVWARTMKWVLAKIATRKRKHESNKKRKKRKQAKQLDILPREPRNTDRQKTWSRILVALPSSTNHLLVHERRRRTRWRSRMKRQRDKARLKMWGTRMSRMTMRRCVSK